MSLTCQSIVTHCLKHLITYYFCLYLIVKDESNSLSRQFICSWILGQHDPQHDWSIKKSTHQCVWKHILSIVTIQHVAGISPSKPVKHTNLGAEADSLLLAWWCLSNTSKVHLITVLQTHLKSPEDGFNVNRIQFKSLLFIKGYFCVRTVLVCCRVDTQNENGSL